MDETMERGWAPGATIARYRIEGVVGRGGMGVVYRALDPRLGRHVALKVLPEAVGHDTSRRSRFLREARLAATLNDPRIATVYEFGESEGRDFIAMEYVDGPTLAEELLAGALPPVRALTLALGIARAAACAHRTGVVHRDLKPANVKVTDTDVKVLDFGLARSLLAGAGETWAGDGEEDSAEAESWATRAGQVMGTPGYMAPEQAAGKTADARADVFAIGSMLFEMLAGRPLLAHATATERLAATPLLNAEVLLVGVPGLSAPLQALIERCLAQDPDARYADGSALAEALAEALGAAQASSGAALLPNGATLAPSAPAPGRPSLWRRGAALAALGGAAATGAAWLAYRTPEPGATVPPRRPVPITELAAPRTSSEQALREYQAGLQAIRDGDWNAQEGRFERAVQLDPNFAMAQLRLVQRWGSSRDAAWEKATFRKAKELRGDLNERDLALLEAQEPQFLSDDPDWGESERRYEEAVRRFPDDVELVFGLGAIRAARGNTADGIVLYRQALEMDPYFGSAWRMLSRGLIRLGQFEEAGRAQDSCLVMLPAGTACYWARLGLHSRLGNCDDYEADLRHLRAIYPAESMLNTWLAAAIAARGGAEESVRDLLQQARHDLAPAQAAQQLTVDDAQFALWTGDFPRAEELLLQWSTDLLAASPERDAQLPVVLHRLELYGEQGRREEAALLAREFTTRLDTLLPSPFPNADQLRTHPTPYLLRVQLDGGLATAQEVERGRAAWLTTHAAAVTADLEPQLWHHGYARTVRNEEEARAALERLPDYGGLLQAYDGPIDLDIGRTLRLGGRPADAIPHLRRIAHTCQVLEHPLEVSAAKVELGLALSATGDQPGACAEYRSVLLRWGGTTSRSADRARAEAAACAP